MFKTVSEYYAVLSELGLAESKPDRTVRFFGWVTSVEVRTFETGKHLITAQLRDYDPRGGRDFLMAPRLSIWGRPDLVDKLEGSLIVGDAWEQYNEFDGADGETRIGENKAVRNLTIVASADKVASTVKKLRKSVKKEKVA